MRVRRHSLSHRQLVLQIHKLDLVAISRDVSSGGSPAAVESRRLDALDGQGRGAGDVLLLVARLQPGLRVVVRPTLRLDHLGQIVQVLALGVHANLGLG